MRYLAVCGADGSGKSTLVDALAEEMGLRAYPEQPFALPEFRQWLADPNPKTLKLAQAAFLTHAARRQISASVSGGVVERLLSDNLQVFAAYQASVGQLHSEDFEELCRLHDELSKGVTPPDAVVYLFASPQALAESITGRGREDDVSMDLITVRGLAEAYDRWATGYADSFVLKFPAFCDEPPSMARNIRETLSTRR